MSKVKYFSSKFNNEIKEVPFVKESEAFVTILRKKWYLSRDSDEMEAHRTAKHSSTDDYYDSWQEAHNALVKREQSRVDFLASELQKARSSLGQAQSMKAPISSPASSNSINATSGDHARKG